MRLLSSLHKILLSMNSTKRTRESTDARVSDIDTAKVRRYVKNQKVVKLHFGCGPRILKGWLNIDLMFEPYEEYLKYYTDKFYPSKIRGGINDFIAIDITKTSLPLPDGSVDVIFHEDFLEHISQRDQIAFLAETLRVLKPGGVHRVNTPNLKTSMQTHSDFKNGKAGIFFDEWDRNGHIVVMTPAYLKEMAKMVGYSSAIVTTRNTSASRYIPSEYRPDPNDRPEKGNIFMDLIK